MQLQLFLQILGAALAVASVPEATNSTLPEGFAKHKSDPVCYADEDGNRRVLRGKPWGFIPPEHVTVPECLLECEKAGFGSAGLEYGQECYCGCSVPEETPKVPLEHCSYPCKGDSRHFCGGYNRMLVYKI